MLNVLPCSRRLAVDQPYCDIRAGTWNLSPCTDFPELSGFGFLNVHVKILLFADEQSTSESFLSNVLHV